MNAVEIKGVVKRYGDFTAVNAVSFNIPQGGIYGVLGPNGAGKTSTMRMMMQITLPDAGEIRVLGQPVASLDTDNVGYLPEERGLYKKMKVGDVLVFFAQIKGLERAEARKRAAAWLERLSLTDCIEKSVEDLSKGMQQKVQFIVTVIHEPDLLVLDEPFSGLDPVNTNLLMEIILEYHKRGHTIVFSTHMMDQVEKLCERICLINRGRIVLEGELAAIKRSYGKGGISIRFSGDGSFLGGLPEVEHFNDYGNEAFLRLHDGADSARVLDAARERLEITRFEVAEPSIHDIFIERVQST